MSKENKSVKEVMENIEKRSYPPVICIREVNENLRRVELGEELTRPLKQLNMNCKFRKKYEEWCDIKYGITEEEKLRIAKQVEYQNRPETKAYQKAYRSRPDVKAYKKEYQKEYLARPEVKAKANERKKKHRAYMRTPQYKARQKARRDNPEYRAKQREYYKKWKEMKQQNDKTI